MTLGSKQSYKQALKCWLLALTDTLSNNDGSVSHTVHSLPSRSLPTRLASYSSPITSFRVGNHTYYIDNSISADKRREYIKQAQRLRK